MNSESSCPFCLRPGPFSPLFAGASLRESRCSGCKAPRRCRDLMRVLLAEYGARDRLKKLLIYELQAKGPVHDALCLSSGYESSEYFPDIKPGERNSAGIRCEDATKLTFPDNYFDLVISQDVMEHIEESWQAFSEINRVLKPGGKHIFTVPLNEARPTRTRRNLPELRHGDPLNPEGALVYWDYGEDLVEKLKALGIKARLALTSSFYTPDEICRVENEADYACYHDFIARRDKISFFLYNSNVFIAEKA